tara:strand:- start:293 stop:514 length:222 start_codon:yes stop_codon:yes gene_type:complete
MNRKIDILEDAFIEFNELSQITFKNNGDYSVQVIIDNIFDCNCWIFIDSEMEDRQYIAINYEVIYLDTLKEIK